MGYHQALPDAEIVGVDIEPQPDYPFTFVQGDALKADVEGFDLVHASPPCQDYSPMSNRWGSDEPRLIGEVRTLISGQPYVIENVEGARHDMATTLKLCGTMFDLPTRRHRLFETSFLCWQLLCRIHSQDLISVYGKPDGRWLTIRKDGTRQHAWGSVADGQRALGISWTDDWHQLREAIPPAYTRWIGGFLP